MHRSSSSGARPRWLVGLAGAAAVACAVGVVSANTADATAHGPGHQRGVGQAGPVVEHTGRGPTGYQVTFRYYDPTASRVQIKGEWYFEDPSALPQLASTPDYTVQTPGLLPSQWKPGDVPIASPNSTSPNWPVLDMKEIGRSGVWTFTTPLPSGVFSYGFYVNCTSADQSGCTEVADPANPAWTVRRGITDTSAEAVSQVYVPSDPRFDTVDYSWQAPAPDGRHGALTHVTYNSPGHTSPTDKNYLVVYTPPGYDPDRAKPYPTFYLSHGGGGNELDWSTQGDVANILDNLIDKGQIQPMVVVMPNASGFSGANNNQAYRDDLINRVIPLVEQRWHVSTSASQRAFSGLSMGGTLTNALMLNNTDQFGYYGMMSAGLAPGTTLTSTQIAAIKKANVFVGAGWQDPIFAVGFVLNGVPLHTGPAQEVRTLTDAGIHVSTDFVNGGHEWYVWRILLRDFLTRVAFWPSPEATWSTG